MTVAVVVFPGSNCEHDVVEAMAGLGVRAELVFHRETSLGNAEAVVLPGGFAHGDYLRPGAFAQFSPVMGVVAEFAAAGGPVLGICNGFQVLTEAGLLPGALQKNQGLKFLCTMVEVEVVPNRSMLTSGVPEGTRLSIPINHFEGNYICDPASYDRLVAEERIVLRYVDNPNGSVGSIAGICNQAGNVVGLMPHPERACDPLLGSEDGCVLLRSFLGARFKSGSETVRTGAR